jgi:capsular exopolysaccharide synthesis family protein
MDEDRFNRLVTALERAMLPTGTNLPAPKPTGVYSGRYANFPDAYPANNNGGEDVVGISLFELSKIIGRNKFTLIPFALGGAMLGILFTIAQTPVYQARTSLEIADLNQSFLSMKVGPVSESSEYTALTDIQTQIKIIQTEKLLDAVVKKLNGGKLIDVRATDARPSRGEIPTWGRMFNLPAPPTLTPHERTLKAVRDSVQVRAPSQARIIEILADSTDPRLAADFVNTLANQFVDQNVEARWSTAQRTGEWLERQLDAMRIKLEHSEDVLQTYAQRSGLLFTGEKTSVSEDKLRQLQQSLSVAQAERVAKQSRYEIAKDTSVDSLADVLNDTTLRNYQEKITNLRQQAAELSGTYTSTNSRVKKVEAQTAEVEAAFQRVRDLILKRIQNDYEEAVRREKLLAADYANQSRLLSEENGRSIQYNILKREVDSNRQIYDAMLAKVKEASVASAMQASNVRIADPAKVPPRPYKPRLTIDTAVGLIAGIFVGVPFILLRERADRTIQQPGDTPFHLGVPELGVIPADDTMGRHPFYSFRRPARGEGASESPVSPGALVASNEHGLPVPARSNRVELVTWERRWSMAAESFRALLTSILFCGQNGDRPKVLVLTSSNHAEGKTTVACNLAIALSQIQQRVLLIDADLRKPRVHDIFNLPNERGLRDLLQQRPLTKSVLDGLPQPTAIPGLFALTSGRVAAGAEVLLYSANLADLLAKFKAEFDMVLVDSPPMLQMSDARVVGRVADAVVLVARAGTTTRDAAIAAHQRFVEDQTRVLGTILNNWNP